MGGYLRGVLAVCLLLLSACAGEEGTPDAGPSLCGEAPDTRPAPECTGLDECGAGASNFKEVVFCDNCPYRADSHLCEAGCCRLIAQNLPQAALLLTVPEAGRGAVSFTVTSFVPTMADGGTLSCAMLLSAGFQLVGNKNLNAVNSTFKRFDPAAEPGIVYSSGISVDPGEGRIIFVQATTQMQGTGSIVAIGCAEDVQVANPGDRVAIDLKAP